MKLSLLFLFASAPLVHSIRNAGRVEDDAARDARRLRFLQDSEGVGDVPTHHLGGNVLNVRRLSKKGKGGSKKESKKGGKKGTRGSEDGIGENNNEEACFAECDPEGVVLADYPQWQEEEGYWIGEYTFYQGDGTPFVSRNWNYQYGAYRGFITGNVQGNAYRQRNVFFYPPQTDEACATNPSVQGEGNCGVNGNTKIFSADQSATTCNTNPENGGDISGPFAGVFDTTTELVGADNALLYQVYLFGALYQSQLTTLSVDADNGQTRRTRSAQVFADGVPRSMSFYRERKVDKATFYAEMEATIADYNILAPDVCGWVDNPLFDPPVIETGLEVGIDGCRAHLEESFEL